MNESDAFRYLSEYYANMSPEEISRVAKLSRESDYVRQNFPAHWAILNEVHTLRRELHREAGRLGQVIDRLR